MAIGLKIRAAEPLGCHPHVTTLFGSVCRRSACARALLNVSARYESSSDYFTRLSCTLLVVLLKTVMMALVQIGWSDTGGARSARLWLKSTTRSDPEE